MTRKRFAWIIAVVLLVGAIAAAVVIAYRDSIGRRIVNVALEDTEYAVTGLSVESLSKDRITFSDLVVEHTGGMRIAVQGVTLPVNIRERRIRELSIEVVEIVPAQGDNAPVSYSELLQAALHANELAPDVTVEIGQVILPWLPDLLEFEWRASRQGQVVRFDVDDFTVEAQAGRQESGFNFAGGARTADGDRALALSGTARDDGGDTVLLVNMEAGLGYTLPVLRALGAVPPEVESLAGEVRAQLEGRVPSTPGEDIVSAGVTWLDEGISVSYRTGGATLVDVKTSELGPVGVEFGYPSLDWRALADEMEARVVIDGEEPLELAFEGFSCRSGIECQLTVSYEERDVADDAWNIGLLAVVAPIRLQVGDQVSFSSLSPASIRLDEVSIGDWSLEAVSLQGELNGNEDRYQAAMNMVAGDGIGGRLTLGYDVERSEGSVRFEEGMIDFSVRNASKVFGSWDNEWDVVSGTMSAAAEARWAAGREQTDYTADIEIRLEDLAGSYDDMVFAGLSAASEATLRPGEPFVLQPFDVLVSLFDIGFPVENLRARLEPRWEQRTVAVSSVQMEALGGRVTVDSFEYSAEADENRLVLRPEAIQLQLIVDLVDFEAVIVEGSVSGEIPVKIKEQGITAEAGRVASDAPGGAIRFPSGIPGVDDSDPSSQLGMVAAALSNFEFETLTSDVNYTADGDLLLQMRMQGVNPDVDPLQPVVLNLGLENNVPELLRSLQAARSISDILDRRFAKQGVSP